jgi:FkbM family methyltransferase
MRRIARRFGLEVERATPMTQWRVRQPALMRSLSIDLVLDVGANDGGFATQLFDAGWRGQIMSFEPLPDAWDALKRRSLAYSGLWTVAPRMALSDHAGTATFHEAGNSVSSSLLQMTSTHTEAAAESATVRTHTVPINTLDQVLSAAVPQAAYLKIDVQGAEKMVLDGAKEGLRGPIKAVQLEMSLTRLYEGQSLSDDLDQHLRALGFELWDIIPGFRNSKTLRLLQYDGIYVRN